MPHTTPKPHPRPAEQGFMLLGLIVTIFLILLVLGVAAPHLAKSLRRDRETEAVRRGNQYIRAIQLFYRKTGHYPGSLDQLEKTNNIRFLRQRYVDPMTGKPDWRLIHVGEAKTTVKGFFGQPLAGIASPGLGTASSMVSNSAVGTASSGANRANSTLSNAAIGGTGTPGNASGQTSSGFDTLTSGSGPNSTSPSSSSGISSQSATSLTGTGAPIVGVGSSAPGDSILVLNEQKTYPTWEFLYDPRVEQLKAKAAMLGGPASTNTSGIGGSATTPGLNGPTMPGGNTTPSTSPTTPSPGPPSTPPQ